jgi:hypothetical protein
MKNIMIRKIVTDYNKSEYKSGYYTKDVFMNYVSCFIRKEKPLKEYEELLTDKGFLRIHQS